MSRSVLVRGVVAALVLAAGAAGAGAARGGPVFSSDVTVDGTLVGTFAIDTYQESSVAGKSFGISIQGGFNPAAGYALPPGYEYRWIQTVSTTIPAYSWQDANVAYVDRTREGANGEQARSDTPFYGDGIVTPTDQYKLPFADNPSRNAGPTAFAGTWSLSLVAVQAGSDPNAFNQAAAGSERAIYQLATFVWGFDLDDQRNAVPRLPITELPSDPTLLAGIFAADPDKGTFGGGAWDVRGGLPGASPGVIPEPSSYLLALAAVAGIGIPVVRSRRRRVA